MPDRATTSSDETVKELRNARAILTRLNGGLVVSCGARPGNPLEGAETMARMARAAELGGARGVRVTGTRDIEAVQRASTLPIIGVNRIEHRDSPVTITPTIASATAILGTGVKLIALDGTGRRRPDGERLDAIVAAIHAHGALALGDLSTIDDLAPAVRAGVDAVGTTLSGVTAGSPAGAGPDFTLLAELVKRSPVPVYAEGRFWTPEEVTRALGSGAAFVVIGTAITNPMAITSRFVSAIDAMTPDTR
ncbi:MAG: N-acetylmannosamine-6-phosphate 2-epimerase [Chloroflexia bacterium]|nr:N-acetylmannosamine-6-phosphate 2-epimerase [Chloroflexia bacterium]